MIDTGARKLNLMVLDDDPSIVRIVSKMLQDALADRIILTPMTDPAEAKAWLDENCCDILISDIEMPEIDGLEMLRFAKQRNAWTQVIFLTGRSTWDNIAEAIEQGASDYLLKQINREELVQLVSQMCSRFARWQSAVLGTLDMATTA